jgi:hypothetical protein
MSDAIKRIEWSWDICMACVRLPVSSLKCLKVHLLCMDVISNLVLVQCLVVIMPLWPSLFLLWDIIIIIIIIICVLYVCLWHTGVGCVNLCIWIVWNSRLNCCFLVMRRNVPWFLRAVGGNLLNSAMQVRKNLDLQWREWWVCSVWRGCGSFCGKVWFTASEFGGKYWKYCSRVGRSSRLRSVTSWMWRCCDTGLWCLVWSCKGVFSELRDRRVEGAVHKMLKYRSTGLSKSLLCTWWLQHTKLQVMLKVSAASLQTLTHRTVWRPTARAGGGR